MNYYNNSFLQHLWSISSVASASLSRWGYISEATDPSKSDNYSDCRAAQEKEVMNTDRQLVSACPLWKP